MEQRGVPQAIYLTNKDHTRKSVELKERFQCPIWIHESDQELANLSIDQVFQDGQVLPGGFTVIQLHDCKSPGESALYKKADKGVVIIGDALIGNPPGELHLLPPAKVPYPEKAAQSIKRLLDYDFDAVLVGDGQSFPEEGRKAIQNFLRGYSL